MNIKHKIGVVSYLNTKPLIHGIKDSDIKNEAEFIYETPSKLFQLFQEDKLDIALLPIVALKYFPQAHVVSQYCIGCEGEVASVGIVSDSIISDITEIYLDEESKTSNALLKILMEKYWKKKIIYLSKKKSQQLILNKNQGALVIGDKAFVYKQQYTYYDDLGLAWKELTGLPFVFAAWLSKRQIDNRFKQKFDMFQTQNLKLIDSLVETLNYPHYNLHQYYKQNISYYLTDQKKKAFELFLSWID